MSYRYLGGLVINPVRDGKGQSVKRGRGGKWPTNGRTVKGHSGNKGGGLGLWEAGTLGRGGGRNGRPRSQPERGQGRDLN